MDAVGADRKVDRLRHTRHGALTLPPNKAVRLAAPPTNPSSSSALRVILFFLTEKDDLGKMADMLRERFTGLYKCRDKSPLKIRAGQGLFAERVALQIPLFEGILRDIEITRLPTRDN